MAVFSRMDFLWKKECAGVFFKDYLTGVTVLEKIHRDEAVALKGGDKPAGMAVGPL